MMVLINFASSHIHANITGYRSIRQVLIFTDWKTWGLELKLKTYCIGVSNIYPTNVSRPRRKYKNLACYTVFRQDWSGEEWVSFVWWGSKKKKRLWCTDEFILHVTCNQANYYTVIDAKWLCWCWWRSYCVASCVLTIHILNSLGPLLPTVIIRIYLSVWG